MVSEESWSLSSLILHSFYFLLDPTSFSSIPRGTLPNGSLSSTLDYSDYNDKALLFLSAPYPISNGFDTFSSSTSAASTLESLRPRDSSTDERFF